MLIHCSPWYFIFKFNPGNEFNLFRLLKLKLKLNIFQQLQLFDVIFFN